MAYRKEMENRKNGADAPSDHQLFVPIARDDLAKRAAHLPSLRRTFFVAETESHYEALVRLEDGPRRVSGHAQEPRWRQGWARQDGGVVLLERVPRARSSAVTSCLLKAYRQARAAWRNGAVSNGDEPANRTAQEVNA